MDPYRKKDKRRAVFGTVLFHLLLLFCLIFFGLRTPLPLPEEEGVLVALGNIDQGMGDLTPLTAPQPAASSSEATKSPSLENVATQSTEESIALPEDKDDTEDKSDTDDPTPNEPINKNVEEEVVEKDPEPVVDPRALFPGSDDKSSSQDSQGDTEKDGTQGSQSGTIDGDSYEGTGKGGGVEFSLSGRKANYLPIPEYTSEAQGKVVVAITVNKNGQITRANAGARGTNTTDQTLWNLAEEAAKRARFDIKQNAPEEQTGTITYNFIRIN